MIAGEGGLEGAGSVLIPVGGILGGADPTLIAAARGRLEEVGPVLLAAAGVALEGAGPVLVATGGGLGGEEPTLGSLLFPGDMNGTRARSLRGSEGLVTSLSGAAVSAELRSTRDHTIIFRDIVRT